jgi:hypothetical protein
VNLKGITKTLCTSALFSPTYFTRGVQNNRLTEKTEEKLTEKTEPKLKTD